MPRSPDQLRHDARRIWQAGLEAVRSERLVHEALRWEPTGVSVGEEFFELRPEARVAVVGAGKAGAGMALAVEEALAPLVAQGRVGGWVNVPADCVRPSQGIQLHAARPAGVNEPTAQGVAGAAEILRIVGQLQPYDLCLCLISGGGSALLPAPAAGVALADKLAVTRLLSAGGATIDELNTVRKQLSRIKGGGLARACKAQRLVALIISDVLGDPLDVIASGPTVVDSSTPQAALEILQRFGAVAAGVPQQLLDDLARRAARPPAPPACRAVNLIIGNNARAVDAAGIEADRLGYAAAMMSATQSEGPAEPLGQHLAEMALQMRCGPGPDGLITGGEPVVKLIDAARRGRGGRNQQLVLAAAQHLLSKTTEGRPGEGIIVLSGGTDGEDGPTDAAGAWIDADTLAEAQQRGLNLAEHLARNDAYTFFEALGTLLKTGPTNTNVCDLRVVLVDRL